MDPLKSAIGKKIRQTTDYFRGISRVDNAADPTSAYSMMKRKQRSTLPRDKQPKAVIGKGVN